MSRSTSGPGLEISVGVHALDFQRQRSPAFSRLPAELLGLIAGHTGSWDQYERASLCRLNKFCNAACTPFLYSGRIRISLERILNRFSNTILLHRPDLASLVKDLFFDADSGWKDEWYENILPKRSH